MLRIGQANTGEKTKTLCWLCDKYGNLARYCRLTNFRLIRPYQDDGRMYRVDRNWSHKRNCCGKVQECVEL